MQRYIDPLDKPLDLEDKTVLVVDENPHTRQLLIDMCRSLHVRQAIVAKCATEAMSILKSQKIDVVISDWSQPPLDASKFVMCVRNSEDPRIRQVPVIVMKANAKASDVIQARDGGASEFLAFPLSITSLVRRLESIFLKPRAFVDARSFHGPDRRRRASAVGHERRRHSDTAGDSES